jgi:hypothetical protein
MESRLVDDAEQRLERFTAALWGTLSGRAASDDFFLFVGTPIGEFNDTELPVRMRDAASSSLSKGIYDSGWVGAGMFGASMARADVSVTALVARDRLISESMGSFTAVVPADVLPPASGGATKAGDVSLSVPILLGAEEDTVALTVRLQVTRWSGPGAERSGTIVVGKAVVTTVSD